MQSSINILLISLCSMLGGAFAGAWLRNHLPDRHLSAGSASVVRAGVGLISTMAALILGLLISTATVSYNSTANDLHQMTADIVLTDQLLAQYGPQANQTREDVRTAVKLLVQNVWGAARQPLSKPRSFVPTIRWQQFSADFKNLPDQTESQHALRAQINETANRLAQSRLQIFSNTGARLPAPFLVILVFWLTVIFTSYTLFGDWNPTVAVFVVLFALSAAGALFLIGELNSPFRGVLALPRAPLENALAPLPR
jgi:uncharacterized membrane protein YphA (DoxX/SURF4 family)